MQGFGSRLLGEVERSQKRRRVGSRETNPQQQGAARPPCCTPRALPGTLPEHLPEAGVDFPVDGLRQGVVDVNPEEGAGGVRPLLQAHGLQGAVVALVPVAALRDGRRRP